jgi:hypothetical protein
MVLAEFLAVLDAIDAAADARADRVCARLHA